MKDPKKKTPPNIAQNIRRKVQLLPASQVRQDDEGFISPHLQNLRRNQNLTPDQKVQLENIERVRRERYNAPVEVSIPSYLQKSGQNIPAYRYNNPGNLRDTRTGEFVRFENPVAGARALDRQLRLDTARNLTVEEFVYKYAPPEENDTELYIQQLTNSTGVRRDAVLNQVPLSELSRFVARKESGTRITRESEPTRRRGSGGRF